MKGKWTPKRKVWERAIADHNNMLAARKPGTVWKKQNINSPEYKKEKEALYDVRQRAKSATNQELERLCIAEEERSNSEGTFPWIDERLLAVYEVMAERVANDDELRAWFSLDSGETGAEKVVENGYTPEERENIHRQLKIAQDKVRQLRNDKLLLIEDAREPSSEFLRQLADKCRKKNGKVNWSEIGRKIGRSHVTAKKWCRKAGIK